MRIRKLIAVGITLFFGLPSMVGAAVSVDGKYFEKKVDVMGRQLHLQGAALLRYMVFIKAYAGALYLPEYTEKDQSLDAVAKRLELEYYHPIKKEDFAEATRVKIRENVSEREYANLSTRIEELGKLYRDVESGDRYSLTFVPGQGTVLSLNGTPLGTIPGDDFANAVFAIWLGENPIDEEFRDRLLGIS